MMIHDWNSGKIPFYVNPPEIDETNTETRLVEGGFSEEFNIEKFMAKNHKAALDLSRKESRWSSDKYLQVDSEKFMIGTEVVDEGTELADVFGDMVGMETDMDEEEEESDVELIDDDVMNTHSFRNA